jgi:hypothetical protein
MYCDSQCSCRGIGIRDNHTITPTWLRMEEGHGHTKVYLREPIQPDPRNVSHVMLVTRIKFPERFIRFYCELEGVPPEEVVKECQFLRYYSKPHYYLKVRVPLYVWNAREDFNVETYPVLKI